MSEPGNFQRVLQMLRNRPAGTDPRSMGPAIRASKSAGMPPMPGGAPGGMQPGAMPPGMRPGGGKSQMAPPVQAVPLPGRAGKSQAQPPVQGMPPPRMQAPTMPPQGPGTV